MSAALTAAAAIALAACVSEPTSSTAGSLCGEDPPGSIDAPGATVQSTTGLFQARLGRMTPAAPRGGDNAWELLLTPARAEPTAIEAVRMRAWMPRHGHGTRPPWNEVVALAEPGAFQVGPFELYMDGLWEFTVEATVDGVTDTAKLSFCIEGADEPRPVTDAGASPSDDAGAAPACTVTAPSSCTDPSLRYADIEPIIRERCQSCHDGQGPQWPLARYSHVADWHDQIRGMLTACTMPPPEAAGLMTTEERERFLVWLRCGFPE